MRCWMHPAMREKTKKHDCWQHLLRHDRTALQISSMLRYRCCCSCRGGPVELDWKVSSSRLERRAGGSTAAKVSRSGLTEPLRCDGQGGGGETRHAQAAGGPRTAGQPWLLNSR